MIVDNAKFLKIFGYVLPEYIATNNKHKAIAIPDGAILNFTTTVTTNKLVIDATITFNDVGHNVLIPYMSQKYPPVLLIRLSEVVKDETTKTYYIKRDIFNQLFLINNIMFKTSVNRTYVFDVKLVSIHAASFDKNVSYSNHNINWYDLNFHNDINAVFKPYTTASGCLPRFKQSLDVFGHNLDQLKRRYATANNTTISNAVAEMIRQIYEPAINENLISVDSFDEAKAQITANKLVGYSIDIENNEPYFFRFNTNPSYSLEYTNNNKYCKQIIPLQFIGNPATDGLGTTIAMSPNSAYVSLLQDFSLNRKYVYYDQQLNRLLISTQPNDFDKITKTHLFEENTVLSDARDLYVKSNSSITPEVAPMEPVDINKYNTNVLQGFIQHNNYYGCNTEFTNKHLYDILLNETLVNNVIYLNIPNSVGHKVGQVVDLIVNELSENNAELNYNLNLAFSGKWKIVTSHWVFDMTGPTIKYSETLSLTRFNALKNPAQPDSNNLFAFTKTNP